MKKYQVNVEGALTYYCYRYFDIAAESKKQAKERALEIARSDPPGIWGFLPQELEYTNAVYHPAKKYYWRQRSFLAKLEAWLKGGRWNGGLAGPPIELTAVYAEVQENA